MICTGTIEFPGCGRFVRLENHDLKLCATCNSKYRDTDDAIYKEHARPDFLAMCIRNNVKCPITGTDITMHSDIHHIYGREGYYDEWARSVGLSLHIDPRGFLAVSREGHQWIELHPNEAKAKGYSGIRTNK